LYPHAARACARISALMTNCPRPCARPGSQARRQNSLFMAAATQRPDSAPFAVLLCLIVEDEALIALTMEDAFIDAGHQVGGPFGTGAEAEAWLAVNTPAVAVVDALL
ncbi:hypothetical protein WDZ92_48190, partial [Nostoc sp. NIES-2111]